MALDRWCRFLQDFAVFGFWRPLGHQVVLVALLALPVAIVVFRLGRSLGIPLLFWHEDKRKQALAGFALALLGSEVFFVLFLLDRRAQDWTGQLSPEVKADPLRQLTYHLLGSWTVVAVLIVLITAVRLLLRRSPAMTAPMKPPGGGPLKGEVLPRWPLLLGVGGGLLCCYGATLLALPAAHALADALAAAGALRPPLETVLQLGGIAAADRPLHLLAAVFFSVFAALFALGALLPRRLGSTPATALCTALALMAAAYGYLRFHQVSPVLVILVLVGALSLAGLQPYKLRVAALAPCYAQPETRYGVVEPQPPLLQTTQISWAAGGRKRPLLIVCASGGGIRASVWTAAMLAALERRLPGLPYHIRLVTGASGGMVGAGYYVATLKEPGPAGQVQRELPLDELVERLSRDSLSVPVKALVFRDLPGLFWPGWFTADRGTTLEQTWEENLAPTADAGAPNRAFGDLRAGEAAGWRPSLVYSPMLVEDGRRLLISNLDLAGLLRNELPEDAPALQSCSGFELARLFPRQWPQFPLATAARLSASFPYVTPAPVLPTRPRRRVVDAGYYDNFGVNLACSWLDELRGRHLGWLRNEVSGIAVVQIRDGLLDISAPPAGLGPLPADTALSRGMEELSSPPEALLSAHTAAPVFRNDEQLEAMSNHFAALAAEHPEITPGFFTTVRLAFEGTVSLSWYLTRNETESLRRKADEVAEGPEGRKLAAWFRARAG
jgi:hypothetical protein